VSIVHFYILYSLKLVHRGTFKLVHRGTFNPDDGYLSPDCDGPK